jgi:hypothetical protein
MESKKINQLATELTPSLSDLTIIGDPSTGISKKITLSQMASLFTGTVEEYATKTAFPLVGVADTIYIALDTNVLWRWDTGTNAYVELSPNIINSLVFNDANGFDGTIALVGSVATLTITTALTTGSVGFIGASGALLQDNANFFWDDTNNRLGLGTNAPTTAIDVFGSGIIGRLNGTLTNNAFLGFASAGTNRWSIGNVQSDQRFRIFNEATTSELISILSTGEFGIGIANPTTKFHIDGGASALIANLDANVSVAKSVSFRSDNSNRFNIEVSGTESGSNAGANLFVRRYSDAGALIDTPLTITRSTGAITLAGTLNGTSGNFSGNLTLSSAGDNLTLARTGFTSWEFGVGTVSGINGLHIRAGASTYLSINETSGITTFFSSIILGSTTQIYLTSGDLIYNSNAGFGIVTPNGGRLVSIQNGAFGVSGTATFSSSVTQSGFLDILGGSLSSTNGLHMWFNTSTNIAWIQAFQSGVDWRQINYNASVHNFLINDVSSLFINNSRNVGIGVIPAAWNSGYKVLQFNNSCLYSDNAASPSTYYGNNFYVNQAGNGIYLNSAGACTFGMEGNSAVFYNAAIGTSGAVANLTQTLRITGGGNLLLGNISDNGAKLRVNGTIEVMPANTSNKNIRFVTTSGDGGANSAQVYWNIAFGSNAAGGCLGAYDRNGNYAPPSGTITNSNSWTIYGFIGA